MIAIDSAPFTSILDKVRSLQDGLICRATGESFEGGNPKYQALRQELMARPDIKTRLPDFVLKNNNLDQFWNFIKYKFEKYVERREFIWKSFSSLIEYLEENHQTPNMALVSERLENFDPEAVHAMWQKALERRINDPDGAITAARSLIETVCKHILDDSEAQYPLDSDLPKLWSLTAELLNLAPSQHQEPLFKTILGNCQSIVNTLGAIRNKIGDAHGQGRRPVKPKPRHAELSVNLAGTMASFLIATWNERSKPDK